MMAESVLQDLVDLVVEVRQRQDRLEEKIDSLLRVRNCLNGETLLDNADLCKMLGVTKRTLQRYRQFRLIKYYPIEGKVFYKSSEVADFIDSFEVGVARKKKSPLNEESETQE